MANAYHYANTFDDAMAAHFKGLLSMGFDPRQLCCLEAWLDAGKDYPLKVSGSSKISEWRDKGQFLKHAVQTSDVQRPTYSANEPSIYFDSSYLNWNAFNDSRILTNNQITLAIRLKLRSSSVASPQAIIAKGNYDSTNIYVDFFQTAIRYKLGNSALFTHDITSILGNWVTLIIKAAAGSISLQIDGETIAGSFPYATIEANAAPLLIGARTFQGSPSNYLSDCKIKHLAIFSEALDVAATNQLISAISN